MRTLIRYFLTIAIVLGMIGPTNHVQTRPQQNTDVPVFVSVFQDTDPAALTSHQDCADWRINTEGWPCER